MNFKTDMDVSQYVRETTMAAHTPVPEDVKLEQAKIDWADALSFIYPVWWSDCPAKLKGWFDRVLTYGYAYFYDDGGDRGTRIEIRKALILCAAGHTVEYLEETGIAESMRRVMLNDRLLGVGVREARMEILGGMTPYDEVIAGRNLAKAYELGKYF
jgi:NAD(P)H dehydrogenase (quinone)